MQFCKAFDKNFHSTNRNFALQFRINSAPGNALSMQQINETYVSAWTETLYMTHYGRCLQCLLSQRFLFIGLIY